MVWKGHSDLNLTDFAEIILKKFLQSIKFKLHFTQGGTLITKHIAKTIDPLPFLLQYDSIATVGKSRVWWRADIQSGSRVLKKVL